MERKHEIFVKYFKRGMIPFSVEIGYDAGNKRKVIRPPRGYNLFSIKGTICDERKSGIAIRMGTEIKKGRYIILIDIDNKETAAIKNGMELWRKLEEIDGTKRHKQKGGEKRYKK